MMVMHLQRPSRGGLSWRHGKAKKIQGASPKARVDHVARGTSAWKTLCHLVGRNIRTIRIARDVSCDELAAALHCTSKAITRWELGTQCPSMPALLAVSLALDCALNDLMPADVRNVHVMLESPETRTERERAETHAAFAKAEGNVHEAARILGITRGRMRGRLRRFGEAR